MITAKGKKLYFYTRYSEEKQRNGVEIDFLLSNESRTDFKILPLEVKSSRNYSTVSLERFCEIYKKRISSTLVIHPKNLSLTQQLMKIPPYMFFALP